MTIGIDASRANRNYKSGTEWYSYYLIRELARVDSKNQYILYSDSPLKNGLADLTISRGNNSEEIPQIIKGGWQIIKSPHNNFRAKVLNWPFTYFWTQFRLSWEMLIYSPDLLFIPAHTLPFLNRKKSVVTIHDIGFERRHRLYEQSQMGPEGRALNKVINFLVRLFTLGEYGANLLDYYSWSTKFALKHADQVITVSNFSKKEITEIYRVREDKIKVVYNGYDKNLYRKIDNQEEINKVISKYDIRRPYIFYVGRLEKKKNTSTLVNAFAIMREEYKDIKDKLVLIGSASFGFDEVKYVIGEFNLDDEVIITGWVPEEDMPFIYNGASAMILPSFYEGFGIPLLQAMACGTPIVASNAASIPEVADKAALYFNPNDKSEMAQAMAKIILDNDLRDNLIEKGFKRVKYFSIEKCARETLEVLESV